MKKALWLGVLAWVVSSSSARADDEEYSPPEPSSEESSAPSPDSEYRAEAPEAPTSFDSESERTPDSPSEGATDSPSTSQWAHGEDSVDGASNDSSTDNSYPDSGGD